MLPTHESTVLDGTPTGLYAGSWREVWRVSSERAFRTWEKVVKRIADDTLLQCAVYLFASEGDARAGENSGGSGFLVGVPWEAETSVQNQHVYAVTAAHVIEHGNPIIRLNTRNDATTSIALHKGNWICHPKGDDIAITRLELDGDIYRYEFIHGTPAICMTEQLAKIVGLGPGDALFMIGRFMGRDKEPLNSPILRFGHLAGLKTEVVSEGERRHDYMQESFLVEVHSISGFSGSPVIVVIPANRIPDELKDEYSYPDQYYLLGVDWGHLDETTFPGMAGVVPAWKLLDLLNADEVVQMRRERESKVAGKRHPRLDDRSRTQQTLAKNKRDRIDIPIPDKSQFERDLTKAVRRKRDK